MNITTINNSEKLIHISGMFAGGWMWKNPASGFYNANHQLIEDPLCSIGGSVEEITDKIAEQIVQDGGLVTLVSNSLGSLVSLNLAALLPRNVKAVVISGSSGFSAVDLGIQLRPKDPEGMARELLGIICFDPQNADAKSRSFMAETLRDNFQNVVKLIRESNTLKADDYLARVKCPIHAIWGRNDLVTPLKSSIAVLKKYGLKPSIIEECGHSPMFEKPAEFGLLVNQFLQKE